VSFWRSSPSRSLRGRSQPVWPFENRRAAHHATFKRLLLWWQLNERKIDMEALIFGILAIMKLFKPEEKMVPEPLQFRPFDIQALKHVYNGRVESSNRPSARHESYAAQALS
jgi:hypothetical protein